MRLAALQPARQQSRYRRGARGKLRRRRRNEHRHAYLDEKRAVLGSHRSGGEAISRATGLGWIAKADAPVRAVAEGLVASGAAAAERVAADGCARLARVA